MIGTDSSGGTIDELLEELTQELGGVRTGRAGGATEYLRGATAFAVSDGRAVELRLGDEIADAAARTPSTSLSRRGPDWVRFAPPTLDDHAADRLEAWFRVAWRAAGTGKG